MSEIDWMYDSLTERFGETLGERQKVVDALLIARAVVGSGPLGSSNHEGILSVARFILDEWGKCSDDYGEEDTTDNLAESGEPIVLNISTITEADISLTKYGTHTFPEGSLWRNKNGHTMIFTNGEFLVDWSGYRARTDNGVLPFIRIKEEN